MIYRVKRFFAILLAATLFLLTACQFNLDYDAVVSRGPATAANPSSQAESATSREESISSQESVSSQGQEPSSTTASTEETTPSGSAGTQSAAPPTPEKTPSSSTPSSPVTSTAPVQPKVVTVTIPEGYSFMEIAAVLEQKGVCSKADFYTAAQNYQVKSFTIPTSPNRAFKLEGYLFPDTYEFYINDDPVNVIRKMLNNYAAKSGMPSDETLILASIIEKEARSDKEMANVSSVFHNRMKAGMRLDADPTRDYVNKFITGNPLVANPGKYAALYNTYKCASLPAGPICSPSRRAIQAAQNPANTD